MLKANKKTPFSVLLGPGTLPPVSTSSLLSQFQLLALIVSSIVPGYILVY